MLRFLSRRNRNHEQINTNSDIKSQRIPTNKNLIQCRVILLDNSDISIELSVSLSMPPLLLTIFNIYCIHIYMLCPIINFLIGLKIYSNISSYGQKNKKKNFLVSFTLSLSLTHSPRFVKIHSYSNNASERQIQ